MLRFFFKAITSYSFLFISFFVIEIYSIISRKKHIINVRTIISDYFIGRRLLIKPVRLSLIHISEPTRH